LAVGRPGFWCKRTREKRMPRQGLDEVALHERTGLFVKQRVDGG